MKKEPFILYLFRFFMGAALLFLVAMLYWSSILIEENVQNLRQEMTSLHNEMNALNEQITNLSFATPSEGSQVAKKDKPRPHIDVDLPNLLEEDPYYKETLPKQLGSNFKPSGTFKTSTVGKYDNLLPFAEWQEVSVWNDWCSVAVGKQQFGKYETLAPDMAIKMEERKNKEGSTEYWIHLRDQVYWNPLKVSFFPENFNLSDHFTQKHQVTADDFKFYYDAVMNPYMSSLGAVSLRPYFQDIVEFRVVDPLTFVVRWREKKFEEEGKEVLKPKYVAKLLTAGLRPLASFVYQYYANGKKIIEDDKDSNTYRTNAIWAQAFNQHWARNIIVSCGPWIFEGKTDRQINFRRNKNYYEPLAVLVEEREVHLKESADNAWQDFKGNKLTSFNIQPDQLIELDNFKSTPQYKVQANLNDSIERIDFFARAFSYIGWNEKNNLFNSIKVRQALTLAIDRERIINQFLNGMGMQIIGPMYPFDKAYASHIKPWAFDVQKAKRLLEEEGWYDHNGDGIIDKEINGQSVPFRFTLNYLSRASVTKNLAEFIATSLKEIGIICDLNGLDFPDMSAKLKDKNFDAIMMAWSLGSPPDDPRQIWYTDKGDEEGSSNFIGFSNAEVDKIINQLDYEANQEKRLALYKRFQEILHQECPYVFLSCQKVAFLYREPVENVFIPKDRQDLVPGADVAEPDLTAAWFKKQGT